MFPPSEEEPGVTDSSEEYETLNQYLSSNLSQIAHSDYESPSSSTPFSDVPETYFYHSSSDISDQKSTVFASVLSILHSAPISPSEIQLLSSEKSISTTSDDFFKLLSQYYDLHYKELIAANHNILNYYLDNNAVVIIRAKGSLIYSKTQDTYVLVYASYPADGIYFVSSPTIETYYLNGATRSELLSTIAGEAIFYVFSTMNIE